MHVVERQSRNGHSVGRRARRRAILVVLLDHDAVLADVGERDVFIGHGGDGAGRLENGLDAYAVLGVRNGRGRDGDVLHDVVATAADRADGEAVASGTIAIREGDALFE